MTLAPPRPPSSEDLEALIREARARQRRRRLIAAAIVVALAGAAVVVYALATAVSPGGTRTGGSSAPSAAGHGCRADQLAISYVDKGAVMGKEGGLLRFTNVSQSSCRLSGWPTVVAVTPTGKMIRAFRITRPSMLFATFWRHSPRVPTLTLRHGAAGYAVLGGYDNPIGRPSRWRCPTARRLLVSPPGSRYEVTLSGLLWPSRDRPVYLPMCGGKAWVAPVRVRPALGY